MVMSYSSEYSYLISDFLDIESVNCHFCRTTFVEQLTTYWVKQPSEIVKVVASENATPTSTTTDVTNTRVGFDIFYIHQL